jgi:hypothetical protein
VQDSRYSHWKLDLIMLPGKGEDCNKPDLNVTTSKTTCAVSNRRASKTPYLTEANDQTLTPLMSLYAPRAASPP